MIPTPVAFWNLNGSRLDSVGHRVLENSDGLDYFTTGKIGLGWEQANTENRVLRCTDSAFIPANEVSLSVWYRKPDILNEDERTLCSLAKSSGFELLRFSSATSSRPTAKTAFTASGANWSVVLNLPRDTNWHHYCASISVATGQVKVWVDGALMYDGINSILAIEGQSVICLGGSRLPSLPPPKGALDGFGLWHMMLTTEQVAELYNSGNGWEYTPPDNTPDAFVFTEVANADLATEYISDPQTITGIDPGTAISVSGGAYRINGGAWTTDAGTIDAGQTLELRAISSNDPETPVTVSVTVGTVTVDWTITTKAGRTLKQHFIVGPDGIAQSVGACVIVPGWV